MKKVYRDYTFNFTAQQQTLTLPTVNIFTTPVKEKGSIVYDGSTSFLYYSIGTAWLQLPASSGAAPATSSFVVLSLNAALTNERVLTTTSNLSIVDGGPNANVSLLLTPTGVVAGAYSFSDVTVSATGRVVNVAPIAVIVTTEPPIVGNGLGTPVSDRSWMTNTITGTNAVAYGGSGNAVSGNDSGSFSSVNAVVSGINSVTLGGTNGLLTQDETVMLHRLRHTGGAQRRTVVVTMSYVATLNDFVIIVDAIAPATVTLPVAPVNGQTFFIKKWTSATTVTVSAAPNLIDFTVSQVMSLPFESKLVVYDASAGSWMTFPVEAYEQGVEPVQAQDEFIVVDASMGGQQVLFNRGDVQAGNVVTTNTLQGRNPIMPYDTFVGARNTIFGAENGPNAVMFSDTSILGNFNSQSGSIANLTATVIGVNNFQRIGSTRNVVINHDGFEGISFPANDDVAIGWKCMSGPFNIATDTLIGSQIATGIIGIDTGFTGHVMLGYHANAGTAFPYQASIVIGSNANSSVVALGLNEPVMIGKDAGQLNVASARGVCIGRGSAIRSTLGRTVSIGENTGTTAGAANFCVNNPGALIGSAVWFPVGVATVAAGTTVAYTAASGRIGPLVSTARQKTNIRPATIDALTAIKQLRYRLFDLLSRVSDPLTYDPLDPSTHDTVVHATPSSGFIAEEMNDVFPHGVVLDELGEPYSLSPFPVIALMCKAVQQLHQRYIEYQN